MTIRIENISKYYGSQKALDDVSFELKTGELVGFLGPNGAGKSTLMKIITGFLASNTGTVTINNEKVTSSNHEIRKNIGYLPEHNPLYTELYIKEFLTLTAGFYKLSNKKKHVKEVIEMTGLGPEQHKKIKALSKGYRQRVGLAQALIHNPSILILDEPTTGLDPNQLEEIRSLIRNISKEKTVLFSTHIMQEVEAICNRVIIINQGKIITDGSVDQVKLGKLVAKQQVFVEFSTPINKSSLLKIPDVGDVQQITEKSFVLTSSTEKDLRPTIFDFAVKNKLVILTLNEKQGSLESVFQELTRDIVKK